MLVKKKKYKDKEKKLSVFLPKNLLSDLDEIPFAHQEKVIYFYLFVLIQKNEIESNKIKEIPNKFKDNNCFLQDNNNYNLKYFNRINPVFSSFKNEEKQNILNSGVYPENFYNVPKVSGSKPSITNNINIKNINIINCNESPIFNNNNINNTNKLLFERFNVNNNLNNNICNFYDQNKFINYSDLVEYNNINNNFQNYNDESNEINIDINQKENLFNLYNNNLNDLNEINFENNNILNQNNFLDYVKKLRMPLTKYLTTKKGIHEIENYLNFTMYKDMNLLLQLLNKDGLTKLMKNKFGNYFIQGIIRKANYKQVKFILNLISDNFIEISENISGTYVIQRLLDRITTFDQRSFVLKLIENRELELAFNNNATYVLQKIIEKVPDTERIALNEIIINNTFFLSLNPDCVFIVEKFIDTITIKTNQIRIQNIIYLHCLQLSNNPYGKYLIQYILKVWKNQDIQNILNLIIENANYLVQQRYASNVIEKCFEIFDAKNRKKLIRSICLVGNILDVIKNQYGHYVLNKTIKYISEDIKIEIENLLNNKMAEMNKKEKSKSKKFISLLKNNNLFKKKEKNRK